MVFTCKPSIVSLEPCIYFYYVSFRCPTLLTSSLENWTTSMSSTQKLTALETLAIQLEVSLFFLSI